MHVRTEILIDYLPRLEIIPVEAPVEETSSLEDTITPDIVESVWVVVPKKQQKPD